MEKIFAEIDVAENQEKKRTELASLIADIRARDTLLGQSVMYHRSGSQARVNNAAIIDCQGVQTDNGIVWLINSVLIPSF